MSAADEALSLAEAAREYADDFVGMIPQLIDQSIERRRKNACWHEARARHRLSTCLPIFRPWWRAAVKRHAAKCYANKEIAAECARIAKLKPI